MQTTAPAAILGRVVVVLLAAEAIGAALGSILAGLLVDCAPLTTLLNAQAAIYLGSGIIVAALIHRQRQGPPRRHPNS